MQLFILITRYSEIFFGLSEVTISTRGKVRKISTLELRNIQIIRGTAKKVSYKTNFYFIGTMHKQSIVSEDIGGVKRKKNCNVYHLKSGEKVIVYNKST